MKAKALIIAMLLLCATAALAQFDTVPPLPDQIGPGASVDTLLDWTTALYSALVIITSFLSPYLPFLNRIPEAARRTLVVAVVVGVVFLTTGFADGIELVLGYLGAVLTYDKVLKPVGIKTPKPDAVPHEEPQPAPAPAKKKPAPRAKSGGSKPKSKEQ